VKKRNIFFTIVLCLFVAVSIISETVYAVVVGINVVFDPNSYIWDTTVPDPWNAEIWGQDAQRRVDPSSIRLEGIYLPSAPPYPAIHGPRLIVPFNGYDVKSAIFPKLPYDTGTGLLIPGIYRISLEITGYLKPEYHGTPFRGSGIVVVTVL